MCVQVKKMYWEKFKDMFTMILRFTLTFCVYIFQFSFFKS